ncbi:glycosyltransferase family 4 protein [Candidatus Sumerlaeota bacterium]|nr:glycosyltransferase family 4 protein [Candidatus Sumerlaeota bacterium]
MKPSRSMRRIALVVPNLELGGAERQAVELAIQLRRAQWHVVVIAAELHGPLGARLQREGIDLYDLRTEFWRGRNTAGFWLNLIQSILLLRRILRRERVVVAKSFLFWQNVLLPIAAFRLSSVKAVITGRRSMGDYKDGRSHYQLVENLCNLLTTHVVCNSEEVKGDALRRERFLRGKISVIPNGVDGEAFHAERGDAQIDVFGTLTIGTVGNLKKEKRHDVFVRAFSQVAGRFGNVQAVIAGRDMGLRAELTELVADLSLSDRVEFMGAVCADAALYHSFDIFVLTSDEEGMPNALLEAMACGCAIVTTNVGGVRSLVEDGKHALVVPAGDVNAIAAAIIRLLEDPLLRASLGRNGTLRAHAHFTTRAMARNHIRLYKSLVARGRGA